MELRYQTRRLVLPKDLNSGGNLFGGRLLEWIDEECGIFAMLAMKSARVATKLISQIDFRSPATLGDVVDIGIAVTRYGTTSLTLRVEAYNRSSHQVILTIDQFVMVCLDPDGRPRAHGVTAENVDL